MTNRGIASTRAASRIAATATLGAAVILCACGGDSVTGPGADSCGAPPYLTVLPVPEADLVAVSVFGGVDAPGHVLPTAHGGMFLSRADVPVRAPGSLTVTHLRRVRTTDFDGQPDGPEDYAVFFRVCRELSGWFGHVTSLAPIFSPATLDFDECENYATPFVLVESCEARNLNIAVDAGAVIATAAFVVDFGLLDERVTNFYMSPQRFGGAAHAVCMWEQFDAANQAIFFSRLRDLARPDITPVGEPRCGTMEVDVPGSVKGVWAETGVTDPLGGDETRYMALLDYPYRPQQELALSLGPDALGARLAIVPRETSGRVNRAFESVTDDRIYCYGPGVRPSSATSSWFVEKTSDTALRIEWVTHPVDASPCGEDPESWQFSAAAVAMVR